MRFGSVPSFCNVSITKRCGVNTIKRRSFSHVINLKIVPIKTWILSYNTTIVSTRIMYLSIILVRYKANFYDPFDLVINKIYSKFQYIFIFFYFIWSLFSDLSLLLNLFEWVFCYTLLNKLREWVLSSIYFFKEWSKTMISLNIAAFVLQRDTLSNLVSYKFAMINPLRIHKQISRRKISKFLKKN